MKLSVKRFTVIEGPLYELPYGDGGPVAVFDCEVVAVTDKGLYGNYLYVTGNGGRDEDGFSQPNRHYKEQCQAILEAHKHITEIDDAIWQFIPPVPDLEVRLAAEAEIEAHQRLGLGAPNYPYPDYHVVEDAFVVPTPPPALRADDVRAMALEERMRLGGGLSDADRAFLSRYNE